MVLSSDRQTWGSLCTRCDPLVTFENRFVHHFSKIGLKKNHQGPLNQGPLNISKNIVSLVHRGAYCA